MIIISLLRGAILGFAIAAPVGPIGVLCIRRTLAEGRLRGFITGMGAATADAFYGGVAAFGLTAISTFLLDQRLWIHLIGAVLLIVLGVRTLLSQPAPLTTGEPLDRAGDHSRIYLGTLFLTLTNPTTILSFVAIFAGTGLVGAHHAASVAMSLVLGVFAGSALWWLTLSGVVNLVRHRLAPDALRWINRGSGAILIGFAGRRAPLALTSCSWSATARSPCDPLNW